MKYFEDFIVDEEDVVGTHVVSEKDIIAIAGKWDPQPSVAVECLFCR